MGAFGVQDLRAISAERVSLCSNARDLCWSPALALFLGHVAIISLHETFPANEPEETLFITGSFLLTGSLPAQLGSAAGHAWMCPWPAPSE